MEVEHRISDTQRQRPDLRIDLDIGTFWVDVTVAHPCALSRGYVRPLAAASDAENKKFRDYSALALQHGATFIPFALESYGAFGTRAREVMNLLRRAAGNTVLLAADVPGGFPTYATQKIALALQRGNAAIARRGAVESRVAAAGGRRRPE